MDKAEIRRDGETQKLPFEWGSLTWFANAALGNSEDMTVGKCVLKPGEGNPLHYHPNCSEVLVVLQGTIEHVIEEGRTVELNTGDCINIPVRLPHRARNISSDDAILLIAFSSAHRETVEV
jgi:mannose-6-phosphate isomerase-like protein (cupin superfamily)